MIETLLTEEQKELGRKVRVFVKEGPRQLLLDVEADAVEADAIEEKEGRNN